VIGSLHQEGAGERKGGGDRNPNRWKSPSAAVARCGSTKGKQGWKGRVPVGGPPANAMGNGRRENGSVKGLTPLKRGWQGVKGDTEGPKRYGGVGGTTALSLIKQDDGFS